MKKLVLFNLLAAPFFLDAQHYSYTVNLVACKSDKIGVELDCPAMDRDTVRFNFPTTVPGTYAVLDYGNYISEFKAVGKNNKPLKVKKEGRNSFLIFNAKELQRLNYLVRDSWDSKEKNRIFEPAGTGFERDKYFYINNGAVFGFFDNKLLLPFKLNFNCPAKLNGFSSLEKSFQNDSRQLFEATNYHDLVDKPILFTPQKERTLRVANTGITVAGYYAGNDSSAYYIATEIDSAMRAVAVFVGGNLPVENYSFLNYIVDLRDIGTILMSGNIGLLQYPKIMRKMRNKAFGALEHGNSSSYYLPDFGHNSYKGMVSETAIHEFMHIFTPLSLHSNLVGDFDYSHPKMSKHLWLYEGVTEYFATLIAMQGGLSSVDKTVYNTLKDKIVSSYAYPDSIPFTVMSERVFEPPYKNLYDQVYERGAIMAMLLDFEIMRLTGGQKTLRSVVLELVSMYGKNKSFGEEEIIPLFVKMVHPQLKSFFDNYVSGKTPLDITGGFQTIGVTYQKELAGRVPMNLLSKENGVTVNRNVIVNNRVTITKAEENNLAGFKPGDKVDRNAVHSCFKKPDGSFVAEGETVHLKVLRGGKEVELSFVARFTDGKLNDVIQVNRDKTPEQEKLFRLWTQGRTD